jgi:hypothetical protein
MNQQQVSRLDEINLALLNIGRSCMCQIQVEDRLSPSR